MDNKDMYEKLYNYLDNESNNVLDNESNNILDNELNRDINPDMDKELFKMSRQIEKDLDKTFVKFEYGEIINNNSIELILGEQDNIEEHFKEEYSKDETKQYALITKLLRSEYEYYYAIIPYFDNTQKDIDKFNININNLTITNIDGITTNIKANEYYSKNEIKKLIINNKLLIGINCHFSNPNKINYINSALDFDEIVDYYKDPKLILQRWIQKDYLEEIL